MSSKSFKTWLLSAVEGLSILLHNNTLYWQSNCRDLEGILIENIKHMSNLDRINKMYDCKWRWIDFPSKANKEIWSRTDTVLLD